MSRLVNAPPRIMVGATASEAGVAGYVPTPTAGNHTTQFLRKDGTFAVPAVTASGLAYSETPAGLVNGANATYTLANTPPSAAGVMVVLNGVVQYNGVGLDYTVSGTTITFAVAPASGSTIFAYYGSGSGIAFGTGVAAALALAIGTTGAVVLVGGTSALNINGTVGATTPGTGAFTTLSATTSALASNNGDVASANYPSPSTRIGASFDGQNILTLLSYGSNTGFVSGAAGGTKASPTQTLSGSALAILGGLGYNTTNGWGNGDGTSSARVVVVATENHTSTGQGAKIVFDVTPTGSTIAARAPVAEMTSTGLNATAIGATTPAAGAFTTLSASGKLTTPLSATAAAGFIVPHGTAPTSPVDGDVWSTTAGLFIRVNGVTKTVTLT